MYSLRQRRKGKKSSAPIAATRKGKQKAQPVLDLDHDHSSDIGDEEDAEEGFIETETKMLEQLDGVLSQCQLCGHEKFCKVDRAGNHVSLTMGQRRAWANALVRSLSRYYALYNIDISVRHSTPMESL